MPVSRQITGVKPVPPTTYKIPNKFVTPLPSVQRLGTFLIPAVVPQRISEEWALLDYGNSDVVPYKVAKFAWGLPERNHEEFVRTGCALVIFCYTVTRL